MNFLYRYCSYSRPIAHCSRTVALLSCPDDSAWLRTPLECNLPWPFAIDALWELEPILVALHVLSLLAAMLCRAAHANCKTGAMSQCCSMVCKITSTTPFSTINCLLSASCKPNFTKSVHMYPRYSQTSYTAQHMHVDSNQRCRDELASPPKQAATHRF